MICEEAVYDAHSEDTACKKEAEEQKLLKLKRRCKRVLFIVWPAKFALASVSR